MNINWQRIGDGEKGFVEGIDGFWFEVMPRDDGLYALSIWVSDAPSDPDQLRSSWCFFAAADARNINIGKRVIEVVFTALKDALTPDLKARIQKVLDGE